MDRETQTSTPEQQETTSREHEYLNTGRFFESYKPELQELFDVFDWDWSEDPAQVNAQLRKMIGLDHTDISRLQPTPEQEDAAMTIFDRMGLLSEILPSEPTDYNDIVVPGATTMAIKRRLQVRKNALDAGSTTKKTTILNGQRPRDRIDRTNDEIIQAMGVDKDNPWIARELKKGSDAFSTETELGRAAALGLINLPHAQVRRMDLPLIGTNAARRESDAMPRNITDYHYRDKDGQDIIVVNGRAVDRGIDEEGQRREPRPTTMSTIEEWIERHTPNKNDRVLFVVSQPHALRMGREIIQALQQHGLSDIKVDIASGDAPPVTLRTQTIIGEIARMLDNEQRQIAE